MNKKIRQLIVALLVLSALAVFMMYKGNPRTSNVNPLQDVPAAKIAKISVEQSAGSYTLEKKNGTWLITSPLSDVADPQNVDRLIAMLQNFTTESIISETDRRYDFFAVSSHTASHLQVTLDGASSPALDGYVGRDGSTYGSAYFRLQEKVPVYIAGGLRTYVIHEPIKDYRLRKLLPQQVLGATKISVTADKLSIGLSLSSVTWTNNATGLPVSSDWVRGLFGKLDALQVTDYGTGDEPPASLGFPKPALSLSVETSSGSAKAVVGALLPKINNKAAASRFALTEGRTATLIVPDSSVQDILAVLKTFPK